MIVTVKEKGKNEITIKNVCRIEENHAYIKIYRCAEAKDLRDESELVFKGRTHEWDYPIYIPATAKIIIATTSCYNADLEEEKHIDSETSECVSFNYKEEDIHYYTKTQRHRR